MAAPLSWFKVLGDVPNTDGDDFVLRRTFECSCGAHYVFYCQEDNAPELYTFITIGCVCGNLIKMKFPVN